MTNKIKHIIHLGTKTILNVNAVYYNALPTFILHYLPYCIEAYF